MDGMPFAKKSINTKNKIQSAANMLFAHAQK